MVALPRPVVRGTQAAVACGHPLAGMAALRIFERGGNAVDAAIAAAAALAVLLPDACGLGGDAMILVHSSGREIAFNGSGRAPAALERTIPDDGAATAAVPGAVASWETARERAGSLPLAELLGPALELADAGFPAGEALVSAIQRQRERLERGASGWDLLKDPLAPGAHIRQPKLATLLERIGREGPSAFYAGEIGEAIVRRVREDGGMLTPEDLLAHETVERPPVESSYREVGLRFQPPVSQALLAAMILRELERYGDRDDDALLHLGIEAVEAAFAYRDAVSEPGAELHLLGLQLSLDPARASRRGGPKGYSHTTPVACVDGQGTVVSMLVSVFDDFGSASLVPEGGFLLNDRLTGFSKDPGSPNSAAPGRRPVHTLSPALMERGRVVAALVTPGADGQVQTLAQVIDAIARRNEDIATALARPRWRSLDASVVLEEGFSSSAATELVRRGHDIRWLPPGHGLFGATAVAGIDDETGTVFAAADPRRETWAAAW
jgi:gamma-glutamyltranspeptidase/glutathione hydrolase